MCEYGVYVVIEGEVDGDLCVYGVKGVLWLCVVWLIFDVMMLLL